MADNTKRILRLHSSFERLMRDERFTDGRPKGPELRHFIASYYWAAFEMPGREQRDERWERFLDLAGLNARRAGRGFALKEMYRADAPRYEPYEAWRQQECQSLMTRGPRTGEPCGKPGTNRQLRVTDPETGEWGVRGWCYRHRVDADAEWHAEQARVRVGFPVPMPNVGGLLPSYLRAKNWPDIYAASLHQWEPPEIGIVADDWPVLAKVASKHMPKPKLQLLDGDGEDSESALPALRLVT